MLCREQIEVRVSEVVNLLKTLSQPTLEQNLMDNVCSNAHVVL